MPIAVERDVDDPVNVRWHSHIFLNESKSAIPPQSSDEKSQFENNVLSRTEFTLVLVVLLECDVICGQQDNGVSGLRCVILEFLDDGPTFIGLLMKDDRI